MVAAISLFFGAQRAQTASQNFELLNGDILRGEVLERDAKRVVILHPSLGSVEIPAEQITASSAHPGVIGTMNGTRWAATARRLGEDSLSRAFENRRESGRG